MNNILNQIKSYCNDFNSRLAPFFEKVEGQERRVVEAMEYSVTNGGKRLRPFLVSECAKLFDIDFNCSFTAAISLEMLHSYSLIHDDLPAMDNDDLRRGKPTCHKQFDEATAILAGDGLLTFAFEVLAKSDYEDKTKIELIKMLSIASGAVNGMIAGQMLDLSAEKMHNIQNPENIIKRIEEMKTGCLIKYACQAGGIIGQASEKQMQILSDYSRKIGIAFQIADDILDATGSQEIVGKTLKKDKNQNKLTFVSCYGVDEARTMAKRLIHEAKEIIGLFGEKSHTLQDLADFIINRDH
ncbi:MAG: polyprenyl synthetase family protein [Alphaproteobacteria bacterium]|nr:polyprenyl synthetase family protein [Alphaproteobacteria bacterium]